MAEKTDYLQIRVSPAQKARLRSLARSAGEDLSTYVLARALPPAAGRIDQLLEGMVGEGPHRFALAELNDLLAALAPMEFGDATGGMDVRELPPLLANYVAAMVEQAAHLKNVTPPAWAGRVPALERPYFAVAFPALRLHLLRASPAAFKRRNLFVDASIGDRV